MLAQTLNRDFVAAVADATRYVVDQTIAKREAGIFGMPTALDDVDSDGLRVLAVDLANAVRTERAQADVGQPEQIGERPPLRRLPRRGTPT